MLQIKEITKKYILGTQTFHALKGVSLNFRKQEFVSILGQSGSGKTTLLNIIGGLDRYNSGDLIIDNVSTKNYSDKDWDAYRNHRIGFVFQSYNLIPHLDVLSNVELALTLSGVDQKARIAKAKEVIKRVGLEEHMKKKPTQLSGGQQQRVAIARALVNDPKIILADEPTGALDSETSLEIMQLLTEISKDKLIIMVTHNSELANKYSNRIVKLKDGLVTDDSNPYIINEDQALSNKAQKTSMSFFTALKLSFKNLLTKKMRTIITALAGSIGIIGVALVLSLQFGFNQYLSDMERGTFAGLPIQISRTYVDVDSLLSGQGGNDQPAVEGGIGGFQPNNQFSGTNNITQEYIDLLEASELSNYSQIVYNFGFRPTFIYSDGDEFIDINPTGDASLLSSGRSMVAQSAYSDSFLSEFFEVVSGRLYTNNAYEAVLIVNEENRVPNQLLAFFGYEADDDLVIPFEDIVGREFKIFGNNAYYVNNNGIFSARSNSELISIYNDANNSEVITITIVGIIKTNTSFISANEQIIFGEFVQNAIFDLNYSSDVTEAQRQSTTSVRSGVTFNPTYTQEDAIMELGGDRIPSTILIYPNNFDAKEQIVRILGEINEMIDDPITHTDSIAAAISMIKTVMDSISAVLIAFASISLVVSSVMIGIITYTSVLERTKEIGVLRSIGARKKDVSNVFNAESVLIGGFAGLLGVLITYGLVPIINIFLKEATQSDNIASLYLPHAIMLIAISIALTLIAGFIPAKIAAKKDPVAALRSE